MNELWVEFGRRLPEGWKLAGNYLSHPFLRVVLVSFENGRLTISEMTPPNVLYALGEALTSTYGEKEE